MKDNGSSFEWIEVAPGRKVYRKVGTDHRPVREGTLILGNVPLTLEHVDRVPRTFDSRKELKTFLKEKGIYNPYFSS